MSTQETTPPTEPVKKSPPKRKRNRSKPKPDWGKNVATTPDDQQGQPGGYDLSPDLSKYSPAVFEGRWYWLGVLPSLLGLEVVYIAGLAFPKFNAIVTQGLNGTTEREYVNGATAQIDRGKLDLIRHKLRHTMVRWTNHAPDGTGHGDNVGQPVSSGRRARLVTIPTVEAMAASKKSGRSMRAYQSQPGDEPVSRYIYCVPCNGPRDRQLKHPASLDETGLTWED